MKRIGGYIFILVVTVLVFYPWFGNGVLGYGDWVHNLPGRLNEYYRHFLVWDGSVQLGTSLGTSAPNNIVLYPIAWIMAILQQVIHLSSSVTTRIFWYLPYIIFSISGGWYLGWIVSKRKLAAVVSSFLYTFSTFGLLTVQGGQMTVGNAYALAPLVLAFVIMVRRSDSKRYIFYLALATWIQSIYDVRIAYITVLTAAIYLIVANIWRLGDSKAGQLKRFIGALLFTALLSAYWIIPMFLTNSIGSGGLPTAENSAHWLPVLSYAEIKNTLAANHVWWPWSVGEQYPVQPLFFTGVLLAMAGIINLKKNKQAIALLTIWIVGLFLAKGVNNPLGEVYEWLFNNFPGFSFYRDPAKFFTVVILGLSPLAGLGAVNLWSYIKGKWRFMVVALLLIILYWPLNDIVFAQRHGTFVTHKIPEFSSQLQEWFKDNGGGRTLWLPRNQRYIVATQDTPVIDAASIIDSQWSSLSLPNQSGQTDRFVRFINHPYADDLLDRAGVQYVGVPNDTENEIFTHYSPRETYTGLLNNQDWLTKKTGEPAGFDIYKNEGVEPVIYTASSIVSVEDIAFTAFDGLPTLNDQDALYIINHNEESKISSNINQRSILLSLIKDKNEWQQKYNEWKFSLAANFKGRLVFDQSLTGYDISVDGQALNPRTNDQGVVVDGLSLSAGNHHLTISDSGAENIIDTPSFVSLDWQPCPISSVVANITPNESGGLIATSPYGQVAACVEAPVGDLPLGIYLMRSQFINIEGGLLSAQLLYEVYNSANINSLPVKGVQNGAVVFINILEKSATLRLIINTDPESNSKGNIASQISSLQINRLFEKGPEWLLLESDDQIALAPSLNDFTQVSPREYKANIKASDNPYYLILNQAYAPAWNISGVEVLDRIPLNGGLNGWLIKPNEDTEISIKYASVIPYWIGILITVITIGFIKWQLFIQYKKR